MNPIFPYLRRWIVCLALLGTCYAVFADTPEERIVRKLYQHATQVPPASIQVRALLRITQPAGTEAQIDEVVRSEMARLSDESGIPPPGTAQMIRKDVATSNAGVRWMLYQETKLPNFYRIDIKDCLITEPVVDDRLIHSNDVFTAYHINNYGRKDLPYKETSWLGGQINYVQIDKSNKPTVWSQEDLFVAAFMEGIAAKSLVLPLVKNLSPAMREQLRTIGREDGGLFPCVPLDDDKLHDLLNGKDSNIRITIKPTGNATQWAVEIAVHSDRWGGTVQYTLDEKLPYLVSKAKVVNATGDYVSERIGISELGFPASWHTEQHSDKGKFTTKDIRILSVTTNIDLSAVFATNYPAGASVWERVGDGQMREVK